MPREASAGLAIDTPLLPSAGMAMCSLLQMEACRLYKWLLFLNNWKPVPVDV